MDSIEDDIKNRLEKGLIANDGEPIKCECGCTEFNRVNASYGAGGVEEYSLECTNEECLKIVGCWSFGHWQP